MSQLKLDVNQPNKLSDKLIEQLGDWTCLYPFFEGPEWQKIKKELRPDIAGITPDVDVWFRAFKMCPYEKVKVVWLGLSPYYSIDNYTKALVADGLAFSTDQKHSVPPSLFKLYKGIESDLWGGMNLNMDRANELSWLAEQGVLLLNSALTTILNDSKRHLKAWEPFILYVIRVLNMNKKDLLFTGFGTVANVLLTQVSKDKHTIIELEHPAASAYASRNWEHQNVFSRTNEFLSSKGKENILWDRSMVDMDVPF